MSWLLALVSRTVETEAEAREEQRMKAAISRRLFGNAKSNPVDED